MWNSSVDLGRLDYSKNDQNKLKKKKTTTYFFFSFKDYYDEFIKTLTFIFFLLNFKLSSNNIWI